MRKQFKDTVFSLAHIDPEIVVILGDISVFLFNDFKEKFPARFFNLGICENTLISVTSALSARGFHPFVHSINPFLTERCFEQIKLDMCYNQFGGNIVTCGASFDYAWDGSTHHAYTELAQLRLLPSMEVMQPGSKQELDLLIRSQYANGRPSYFRLSDFCHDVAVNEIKFGKAAVLKNNSRHLTIMTAGPILSQVYEATRNLDVNLVYFHTLKPIDQDVIKAFGDTEIIVVHDAHGLREAINEVPGLRTSYVGLRDEFMGCYGTVHDIRRQLGLDAASLRNHFEAVLKKIEGRVCV